MLRAVADIRYTFYPRIYHPIKCFHLVASVQCAYMFPAGPKICVDSKYYVYWMGGPKKQVTRLKNKWIAYKRETANQNMGYVVTCLDRSNWMIRKAIETDST